VVHEQALTAGFRCPTLGGRDLQRGRHFLLRSPHGEGRPPDRSNATKEHEMLTYDDNPDWQEIPPPKPGDCAQLHARDAWTYTVRVTVHDTQDDTVRGEITVVFDRQLGTEIGKDSEVFACVGKKIVFPRSNVFKLVKKSGRRTL